MSEELKKESDILLRVMELVHKQATATSDILLHVTLTVSHSVQQEARGIHTGQALLVLALVNYFHSWHAVDNPKHAFVNLEPDRIPAYTVPSGAA